MTEVRARLVVVAFAAKKLVLDAYVNDAREVVELVKVWSALQVFAFERLSASVPALPPTRAPKVPLYESEAPIVAVVVATFWSEPFPAPYTRLPLVKVV